MSFVIFTACMFSGLVICRTNSGFWNMVLGNELIRSRSKHETVHTPRRCLPHVRVGFEQLTHHRVRCLHLTDTTKCYEILSEQILTCDMKAGFENMFCIIPCIPGLAIMPASCCGCIPPAIPIGFPAPMSPAIGLPAAGFAPAAQGFAGAAAGAAVHKS